MLVKPRLIREAVQARARALGVRLLKKLSHVDHVNIQGSVDVVLRYSDLYPNSKLQGEVHRYLELGPNLVVIGGRRLAGGLVLGTSGPAGVGHSESTGHVIRGMALGTGSTPVANDDTELESPILRSDTGHHYHEIDSAERAASPDTEVTFIKTFGPLEPAPGTLNVTEFGLYSAAPAPIPPATAPAVTTPPGPSTGFYLVGRKVHGLITKTADFTMTVRWKWVF